MYMTKEQWLYKNGFNEKGITWCIYGNTYPIKNHLKERGYKFSPLLKWHRDTPPFDLQEYDFPVISFSFDDLLFWDSKEKNAYYYENAKEKIEKAFVEAEGPSLSEYVGYVGERLYNITAIYKSRRSFLSRFGTTNIYTFESQNNVLVWFTQKELDLEKDCLIDLTGTIKKHELFRNVKTTQLSRCIIKKIGD